MVYKAGTLVDLHFALWDFGTLLAGTVCCTKNGI